MKSTLIPKKKKRIQYIIQIQLGIQIGSIPAQCLFRQGVDIKVILFIF